MPQDSQPYRRLGYSLAICQAAGALLCGLLGVAFAVLAVYLVYAEMHAAGQFRTKFLMMPMMNLLISAMLMFYCRQCAMRMLAIFQQVAAGTFVPPTIRVTRYDFAAIAAFLIFVAAVSWFLLN